MSNMKAISNGAGKIKTVFFFFKDLIGCLWSTGIGSHIKPQVNDVLSHYSHPFPSPDGNKRSFIGITSPKRIPQNGVAPFRMENQSEVEVNWSGMSVEAMTSFIGKF